MTGKFPIANALKRGDLVSVSSEYGSDILDLDLIQKRLRDPGTGFFDVSVASDLYWKGRKDYYELDEDFGPLRAPYPVCWMEWVVPQDVMIDGKPWRRERVTRHGALVTCEMADFRNLTQEQMAASLKVFAESYPGKMRPGWEDHMDEIFPAMKAAMTSRADPVRLQLSASMFIYNEVDDQAMFLPHGKRCSLDPETGLYIPDSAVDAVPQESREHQETADAVAELADPNVAYMALNLINCRNVTTHQSGAVFARSGREKRQGVPSVRYHTIMLPGMSSGSHIKQSAADKAQLAHHRVRGHFKTFTAARPLLGKHVGTYWWGWNMRGSKENGEVVSDYKLDVKS